MSRNQTNRNQTSRNQTSRYTLGLSYGFHDASAALVKDGRVIAMVAEERFTRQKHDDNFPTAAVQACLAQAGISAADLEAVAYHEDPATTFTRVLASTVQGFPHTRREFVTAMKVWLGKKLWVENAISTRLGVEPKRIKKLHHHESHAAQAFYGSGFADAAILTIDAVGEWATTTLSRGRNGKIETLETIEFPHSLGLVYSAFTAYLGFKPMDSECSTMALAAFGRPIFADKIRRMLRVAHDGTYTVDARYFNFHRFFQAPYTQDLLDLLGPARGPKEPLPFTCSGRAAEVPQDAQRFADIAASVQLVLEDAVLGLARRLHRLTGSDNLCFAGGVALNCVANTRLVKDGPFAGFYIPPDPGDGGAAAGAAMALASERGASGVAGYTPYVGPAQDVADLEAMLPHIDPRAFRRHVKVGYKPSRRETWQATRVDDESALLQQVSDEIVTGKIVGWCQGSVESGPRALGARSILIRADDPALAQRLSTHVKDRAAYRPYALAMTEAAAPTILDQPPMDLSPVRWMQLAWPVRADAQSRVRAGLHIDNTTRPQVVRATDHARFHALIERVGEATGTACVINTSFNESGAPVVCTPLDALAMFARTDMDVLVFENLIIRKSR